MQAAFEKRLKRLAADFMQQEDAASAYRSTLRARVAVGSRVRQMLAERGVDPASVTALGHVEAAAGELAELPGGGREDLPAAAIDPRAERDAASFTHELVRMALLHFAAGERPNPASSSLMEWHAWCLVTPASPHHPNILRDPEIVRYQRMLRLGSGDPSWRQPQDADA